MAGSGVVAAVLVLLGASLLIKGEATSALAVFAAALAFALIAVVAAEERALSGGPAQARDFSFHVRSVSSLLIRNEEIVIVAAITLAAGVLRFWALGDVPFGVHGDEAHAGLDGMRVLREGWIGVYTPSALGQPAGHAYLTAPFLEIFGTSAFSLRLPFALVGLAAVPLAYAVFRLQANRTVATIAAILLATSLWHFHFSRVAHWSITYPTVELLVLLFWTLGMRDGRWRWFILAGATLGLGLYTYNVYPIFVIAFAIWVALYTLLSRRGDKFRPWAMRVTAAAAVSVLVAMPLFIYIADGSNHYFEHYNQYYEHFSVLATDAFEQGDTGERIDIVTNQVEKWVGAYGWKGVQDYTDGAGANREPMFDKLTVALLVTGVAYAAWNWRKTPHLMALLFFLTIPLTSVLQINSHYRGPLGAAPFVLFIAALPLAWFWQRSGTLQRPVQWATRLGVVAVLSFIAYTSVHTYFGKWDDSGNFRFVYTEEISAASEYLSALPGEPYAYFLSDRWSYDYETRRFLAPENPGEDRSVKFGKRQDFEIDRTRDSVFLLLAPYMEKLEAIKSAYPGGIEYHGFREERTIFIGYFLPAEVSGQPRPDPGTVALERDADRRGELAAIASALAAYRDANGAYPSTEGRIQSACVYRAIDKLCVLEPELGAGAFVDPRNDTDRFGYWYKSDGTTFALFASMESAVSPADTCPPEDHLRRVSNVLCVRSP